MPLALVHKLLAVLCLVVLLRNMGALRAFEAPPVLPAAIIVFAAAFACLAFVPSMFVHHVNIFEFYNPAGWGATAIASSFPLATWMIVVGILMLRAPGKCDPIVAKGLA